jgi:hypothetical protein
MQENGGALIHVSSVESRRAIPLHAPYTASKFGIRGFTQALRMEVEHAGLPVSVTNVMPSSINTPFFDKALTRLGVTPRPVAPVYEPKVVVNVIMYAAEHPVKEIYAGGSGTMLGLIERISPRLGDKLLRPMAVTGQMTDNPKTDMAPTNLFQPIEGYDQVKGSFSSEAKPFSAYTWLQTHPKVKTAAMLTLGALIPAFAWVSRTRNGHKRNEHKRNERRFTT